MKSAPKKTASALKASAKKRVKKQAVRLSGLEKVVDAMLSDVNFAWLLRKNRSKALAKLPFSLSQGQRKQLEKWAAKATPKKGIRALAVPGWPPAWPADDPKKKPDPADDPKNKPDKDSMS